MSISMNQVTALVAAILLAGCATVSSRPIGQLEVVATAEGAPCGSGDGTNPCISRTAPPAQDGIAYFLPRQLARVTATRTDSQLDAKVKAFIKAQGDLETAQASVSNATAAIRQTEETIIAGAGNDAAQPILAARLAAQRTELAVATALVPTRQAALDRAKADLTAAARPVPAAGRPATDAPPESRGPGSYQVALKIELLPPSADPSQAYRLSPRHSVFRDDEHRLVVGAAGLLTSTEVVAVDRTADILVEIGTFAGAMAGGPVGRTEEEDLCASVPDNFIGIVDFANPESVAELNEDLECLGVRTQAIGPRWAGPIRPGSTSRHGIDGIVYRTPVEVQVRIERCVNRRAACSTDSTDWFPTEVIALSLPQAGPISYVRQDAGFMTRSRYALTFSNGILTNYDASRPSELLELARTPMRVVHGVFDGASKIISLRTGQNTALAAFSASQLAVQNANFALRAGQFTGQGSVTTAQMAALNAEYALRAAQITGETGVATAQLAALNAEFALRAAQITGQTGLTNAEVAALTAQFALQAGQITGQTGLTNIQLGLIQSQGALATGGNNAAAQASASNLALTLSLLRDQARREALNRCIAQQTGLGQPIDSCLVGF